MDFYGIGSAMKAMLRVYQQSARATGRTTKMLDAVKHGDRILVDRPQYRNEIDHQCRKRGLKDVQVLVAGRHIDETLHGTKPRGCLHLEHTVVERLYEDAIRNVDEYITRLVDENSETPERGRLGWYGFAADGRWEAL